MNYLHISGRVISAECFHLLHPVLRNYFRATVKDVTHEVRAEEGKINYVKLK